MGNAIKNNKRNVEDQDAVKRRAIQAIMKDSTLDPTSKRLKVQELMSGRKTKPTLIDPNATCTIATTTAPATTSSAFSNPSSNPSSNNISAVASSTSNTVTQAAATNNEVMKCIHYERKCNIIAPCCGKVFGRRVCHDDASD